MVTLRFPSGDRLGVFFEHLTPFSYLTAVWVLIFFIAGLYDKKTLFFRRQLPSLLFNTQLVNIFIGITMIFLAKRLRQSAKKNTARFIRTYNIFTGLFNLLPIGIADGYWIVKDLVRMLQ